MGIKDRSTFGLQIELGCAIRQSYPVHGHWPSHNTCFKLGRLLKITTNTQLLRTSLNLKSATTLKRHPSKMERPFSVKVYIHTYIQQLFFTDKQMEQKILHRNIDLFAF